MTNLTELKIDATTPNQTVFNLIKGWLSGDPSWDKRVPGTFTAFIRDYTSGGRHTNQEALNQLLLHVQGQPSNYPAWLSSALRHHADH